jgi:hypothetical protein
LGGPTKVVVVRPNGGTSYAVGEPMNVRLPRAPWEAPDPEPPKFDEPWRWRLLHGKAGAPHHW